MGIIEVKVKETSDLLNPIKEKEPCCGMPEDMLELKTGRKMGMSSMGINIGKYANARRGGKRMKTITIRKLRIWISKKRKDDYWTRDDDNGMLDQGKEICLGELEDFWTPLYQIQKIKREVKK